MHIYHDMINEVLRFGTRKENRTGIDTISTFNFNYELAWGPEMYGASEVRGHRPDELSDNRHILDAVPGEGVPIPLLTTSGPLRLLTTMAATPLPPRPETRYSWLEVRLP